MKTRYKCVSQHEVRVQGCGKTFKEDPGKCSNCGNTVFKRIKAPEQEKESKGILAKTKDFIGL